MPTWIKAHIHFGKRRIDAKEKTIDDERLRVSDIDGEVYLPGLQLDTIYSVVHFAFCGPLDKYREKLFTCRPTQLSCGPS